MHSAVKTMHSEVDAYVLCSRGCNCAVEAMHSAGETMHCALYCAGCNCNCAMQDATVYCAVEAVHCANWNCVLHRLKLCAAQAVTGMYRLEMCNV